MKKYKRITFEDRQFIQMRYNSGVSIKKIANELGYSYQSIKAEIERGYICNTYNAEYAQADYLLKKSSKFKKSMFESDRSLAEYVSRAILNDKMSPEDIIENLKYTKFNVKPLSKNTIYSAIDAGLIPGVSRETLKHKRTHLFSNGILKMPRWILDELNINDGDELSIENNNGKIIICRIEG